MKHERIDLERGVTLYCGDCLDILPSLEGVDAVITDPPYGIDWDTNYKRFTPGFDVDRSTHKAIENDGKPFDPVHLITLAKTVVLFGANCYSDKLPCGAWLIWDKRFPNGTAFLADAEAAWMNRGHGVYIYSETAQGFVRKEKSEHPTQKPVAVMGWCMEKAKVPAGALVLDPYMGSGTTGIACLRTGRRFIGIEKDPVHFKTALERIKCELAQGDLFHK